jgi:hypothetical protein
MLIDTISPTQRMWISKSHVMILAFSLISQPAWDAVEEKLRQLVLTHLYSQAFSLPHAPLVNVRFVD